MIRKLMFRLLPVQIILAAVGTVNMIVSSYFASNYVGTEAMSAVGLYSAVNTLAGTIRINCRKFTLSTLCYLLWPDFFLP